MKHTIISAALLLIGVMSPAPATVQSGTFTLGMHVMLGGRYDNLRMCVASAAGAKGGPIADIMIDGRYYFKDDMAIVVNLPVMRPILFALAFKMLQFEPAVNLEVTRTLGDKTDIVLAPGLGASFHYGPDYKSGAENAGPPFFAAGPIVTGFCGIGFAGSSGKQKIVGVRAFYIPLFVSDRPTGTVVGGSLEGHFSFR